MFRWLSDKGIDWSSSQFLSARDPQLGNEPDLTRLKLLKLLNLVRNDGDTREIEGIFREEPKLSYNLLRWSIRSRSVPEPKSAAFTGHCHTWPSPTSALAATVDLRQPSVRGNAPIR